MTAQPPPKQPMTKRSKIAAGIVVGFLLILFGHSLGTPDTTTTTTTAQTAQVQKVEPPKPATPTATPVVINPKTVADAVDANKARAERDWNGKYVQFTAEVTDISTFLGPSVQFGKVTGKSFSLIHFLCSPADESDLIPYTKGQKATVRGVVEVGVGGVIKLNDCEKVG